MSKVVQVEEEEFEDDRSFVVTVVSEGEYVDDPCCPRCRSSSRPKELVHTMSVDDHLVSLHLCEDCFGMFMVASYPTMFQTTAPIRLYFSLKEPSNVEIFQEILDRDATQDAVTLFDMNLP